MRHATLLSVVFVILLAGCTGVIIPDSSTNTTDTPAPDQPSSTDSNSTTSDATDWPTTFGPDAPDSYDDPEDDVLGWEDGYWYNEPLNIDTSNGLNESEIKKVSARSAARVERLRGIEFTDDVPVSIITREEFNTEYRQDSTAYSTAFTNFDNAKFEALFLVGNDENALTVQDDMRGSSVAGFYSPQNNEIVIVSDGSETELDETTLIHEYVHAAQDQKYNLSTYNADTRDAYNAENGLIEGDATHVESRFEEKCESEWSCVTPSDDTTTELPENFHWGIYLLEFFPYSDGYTFIEHLGQNGGWDAIDAAYENPPQSSEVIIHPEKYGTDYPTNLTVPDTSTSEWERITVDNRPDYATIGESGIFTMFANTLFDDTHPSTVLGQSLYTDGTTPDSNSNNPYNYDAPFSNGWGNDKLYVYEQTSGTELGYVWTLHWDTEADATAFSDRYTVLLDYYGATATDTSGVYVIESAPYEGAFSIVQDGDTVTIVNAPSVSELSGLSDSPNNN